MNIKVFLKQMDVNYRNWSKKVYELEQKGELTEQEKFELENLKELMKEKEEEIEHNNR